MGFFFYLVNQDFGDFILLQNFTTYRPLPISTMLYTYIVHMLRFENVLQSLGYPC